MNTFLLTNKTIAITGASSGIGRQCAITCSHLGAQVVLIGRSETRLQETANLCHNSYHLVVHDITDYKGLEEKLIKIYDQTGKWDGIIHAAGVSTTLPLKNISIDKLEPIIHTNVYASILLTKMVTKIGRYNKTGFSVVFLASVMGLVGEVGKAIYSLTKGALVTASKSLALELASKNIRVNCVAPGVVETPMSKTAIYSQNEEALKGIISKHPLGLGEPEDVANACAFLLGSASKWITGTTIVVDGGYTAQ